MKVAVTGGAGFIGHHLVAGLLARGDEVRVIDDFSIGTPTRLAMFADAVAVVRGSVLDAAALDDTFAGCEVVLHHAAIASVAASVRAPRATNEVNTNGTIEVMLAAARQGVRRVVFAGSSAVYGVPAELPCRERQPLEPVSPYGAGKLAAEYLVHSLGSLHGVESVVLRYFNVYGPGQDPAAEYAAVIPRFVVSALAGRRPTINGSGAISRDFVFIDDVVAANIRAADPSSPSRLTCNIASGMGTTLDELLAVIGTVVGRSVEPTYGPPRPGDIEHSVADISAAREALGYEVSVPLVAGIGRTVEAFRGDA